MSKVILTFVVLWFCLPTMGQSHVLPRTPALNHDGSQLAFSWQGDIWIYDFSQKQSRRMTVNESYESNPAWDAEGNQLVFTTNRYGTSDVMIMGVQSGRPQRLTYYSASNTDPVMDEAGNIYFTSSRAYKQLEREFEIMILELGQSTPYRLMDALGSEPVLSPDGEWLAFVRGNCRLTREQYRGPANRDIWLYNLVEDRYIQITTDEGQDANPQWTKNGDLYFMSARTGVYNIYRVELETDGSPGEITAVTSFEEDGIRDYSISGDGSRIVVERRDIFQIVNPGIGAVEVLDLEIASDVYHYQNQFLSLNNDINDYILSPDEKYIAIGARGDLFLIRNDKDNPRTQHLVSHAWNDMNPIWNTANSLVFISDRNGQEDVFEVTSTDTSNKSLYSSFKIEVQQRINTPDAREQELIMSPDNRKVAVKKDFGSLVVYDVDSTGAWSEPRVILEGWAEPSGIAWSPDGRWLAYSLPDLDFNREVYIASSDGKYDPVNISMHPRADRAPVWSPDGSKLAFISNRNNGDDDVWFVWLKRADWEKSQQDWKESIFEEDNTGRDRKKNKDTLVVEIDFDHIHRRIVQVTSMPGDERNALFDKEGKTIYFNGLEAGQSRFFSVKWDGSEQKILADHALSRPNLSRDGKKIYYLSRGQMRVFDIGSKKSETIPFHGRKKMDYDEERNQIFEDLWRALNDRFYDPRFHGRDWKALKDKYKPWAMKASTTQDFREIVNVMLGQLNASHMGLYGSNPESVERISTGRLGIEIKPRDTGVEVLRIVPHTPGDRLESRLMAGDIILAIDGQEINHDINFWSLLMEKENERVWLTVQRGGDVIDVYIRPTTSISEQLYEQWVEERRQLTTRYSEGRLGYIHIQGMNWPSFEAFERELTASGYGKEGLVIDVRYNGGGWTTDMLMTVLMVRQHAYTVPRGATENLSNHSDFQNHYPFGERLPLSAWTLPAAAICNHSSYSNAEIFSHAFKTLGRGPLVGEPTFGAVISTGAHYLVDGSYVRMPFRGWFVKATGDNMETTPAVPDHIVLDPPGIKARGEDPQLKRAVEVLLDSLD